MSDARTPMGDVKNETVSAERLAEMLAGLDGVTPGPWHMYGEPEVGLPAEPFSGSIGRGDMEPVYRGWANLNHIARCDPDTIRSIITELIALRQPDTREGGGEAVAWHLIDIRGRMSDVSDNPTDAEAWREQGYTVRPLYAAPPLNKSPNPEHVEGDVLSVGEMEVVAHAEVLAGRVTAVRIDKGRHCVEPLVTLSAAQSSIQRAERERDEARALGMKHHGRAETYMNAAVGWQRRAETAEDQIKSLEGALRKSLDALEEAEDFAWRSRSRNGGERQKRDVEHKRKYAIEYARAFLASLGEKQDAE